MEEGYFITKDLPFIPTEGMMLLLLGMDFESKVIHAGYVEEGVVGVQKEYFEICLKSSTMNQEQIKGLLENGWTKE